MVPTASGATECENSTAIDDVNKYVQEIYSKCKSSREQNLKGFAIANLYYYVRLL